MRAAQAEKLWNKRTLRGAMRGAASEPPLPRFPSLPEIAPVPREVVPWDDATRRYVRGPRRDIAGEVLRFTLGAVAGMLAVLVVELVSFPTPAAPADDALAAAAAPLIAEPRPPETAPPPPPVTTAATLPTSSPIVLAQRSVPVPTIDVHDLPRAQARRHR